MRKIALLSFFLALTTFSLAQKEAYFDSVYKVCNGLKNENSTFFLERTHSLYSEAKKANNKLYIQKVGNLIGIYFTINQVFDSGYVYFSKGLSLAEKSNNKEAIANSKMNIGIVLRYQKNYLKSEFYFKEALALSKELKNTKIQISGLYNLSGLYLDWARYKDAIAINRESLKISIVTNDMQNQIKSLEALGGNFSELNQLDSAKYYLLLAYEKASAVDYNDEKSYLCNNLAGLFLKLKNYKRAETYLIEAKNHALNKKLNNSLIDIYGNYKDLYFKTKQFEKCILYFHRQDSIKTLIYDDDILNTTTEMEAKYQSEKKELLLNQTKTELNFQAEKNNQKTRIIWLGAIAFTLTLLFLIIAFLNYQKAKKANYIIQNQNQILELQKKEVETQKDIIEEKQNEILSSIRYAKRIQQSLMPTEKYIDRVINKK